MRSYPFMPLIMVFAFAGCFSADDVGDEVANDETLGTSGMMETSTSGSTEASGDSTTETADSIDSSSTSDGVDTSDTDPSDSSSTTEETGPVDTEPPTLEFGAFIDSTHISLTFSEPIASVAGVNPAKFRPSEGWWDSDDSLMVHLDLLNDFPDDYCPCITGFGLENDPGDPYTIILELSAPTNADTCMNASVNYLPVMHYDADTLGTAEHIRDLAGNTLEEFGGLFVESPGESSLTFPADYPYPDFPYGEVLLDYSAICP